LGAANGSRLPPLPFPFFRAKTPQLTAYPFADKNLYA
jgi:hypothetical protein